MVPNLEEVSARATGVVSFVEFNKLNEESKKEKTVENLTKVDVPLLERALSLPLQPNFHSRFPRSF